MHKVMLCEKRGDTSGVILYLGLDNNAARNAMLAARSDNPEYRGKWIRWEDPYGVKFAEIY